MSVSTDCEEWERGCFGTSSQRFAYADKHTVIQFVDTD